MQQAEPCRECPGKVRLSDDETSRQRRLPPSGESRAFLTLLGEAVFRNQREKTIHRRLDPAEVSESTIATGGPKIKAVRATLAVALTLVSAAVCLPGRLQAMEIPKFDKMALQDQSDYITLLVEGAQKVLIHEGKDDLAAKIHKLFTEVFPGDSTPVGLIEFERNLDRARLADIRNLEKDPHAQRLEVEDAMAATLEANGIELPDSFFTLGKDFKPKHSPQKK